VSGEGEGEGEGEGGAQAKAGCYAEAVTFPWARATISARLKD
jgi:hypothetical protein